ncbi:MAG: hypothetical protein J5994_02320 [Ruminococcus sp.]|nr:hypothetical protein [Ruminococcus sp.]
MEEFLRNFLEDEVNGVTYGELWSFVRSDSICRGTYEGQTHVIMKISSNQFIIYRLSIGVENTKCQPALMTAKNYLLKKINSRAYELQLPEIQNILD